MISHAFHRPEDHVCVRAKRSEPEARPAAKARPAPGSLTTALQTAAKACGSPAMYRHLHIPYLNPHKPTAVGAASHFVG